MNYLIIYGVFKNELVHSRIGRGIYPEQTAALPRFGPEKKKRKRKRKKKSKDSKAMSEE